MVSLNLLNSYVLNGEILKKTVSGNSVEEEVVVGVTSGEVFFLPILMVQIEDVALFRKILCQSYQI